MKATSKQWTALSKWNEVSSEKNCNGFSLPARLESLDKSTRQKSPDPGTALYGYPTLEKFPVLSKVAIQYRISNPHE